MKKLIKIGEKNFLINEKGETEEVDVDEEVETTPEPTPTPEPEPTPEPTPEDDVDEGKLDEAAEKIVKKLGLDKLQAKMEEAIASTKAPTKENIRASALIDLGKLMKKDVAELTSREKIIGFFQAMVQNNTATLKALSEGTAADGGYLFPKFIGA